MSTPEPARRVSAAGALHRQRSAFAKRKHYCSLCVSCTQSCEFLFLPLFHYTPAVSLRDKSVHEQKKKITKKKRNQEKKIIKDGYITRTSDLFATFERRVSGTANSFASMAKERGGGGGRSGRGAEAAEGGEGCRSSGLVRIYFWLPSTRRRAVNFQLD